MNCQKCNAGNNNSATYCSNCGNRIKVEQGIDYTIHVKNISIFFFALLSYIIVLQLTNFCDNYIALLIADTLFAVIVLLFFFLNYKSTIKLFNFRKFKISIIIKLLLFVIILAVAVIIFASYYNQKVLNGYDYIYYNQFKHSPAPLLFSIISISVFPAIFEEIAFRGILFDESYKLAGLKPAILITSILFTILHLSLFSILWIFPLSLIFGYLRAKYNTILYGIIGHFVYNTCILLLQIIIP